MFGCEVRGLGINDIDLSLESSVQQLVALLPKSARLVMLSGVKRQLGDSFGSFEKNIQIATTLSRVIERSKPEKVIFFSSAAVYGEETHNLAIAEQTPVNPITCYGISKFASERVLSIAAKNAGSSIVMLRPPVIYGPFDASNSYGPVAFCRSAKKGNAIELWGDGSELREFVYVDDCCRIVESLLGSKFSGVLNLACGKSHSFRDIIDCIAQISGRNLNVIEKARSKEKVDNRFDSSLMNAINPIFQWTDLQSGINQTWQDVTL
jgi:UDP-glucose 4-epimerase